MARPFSGDIDLNNFVRSTLYKNNYTQLLALFGKIVFEKINDFFLQIFTYIFQCKN